MAKRNYWLDLFTGATWQEFLKAGGKVSGFRERRWNTLKKLAGVGVILIFLCPGLLITILSFAEYLTQLTTSGG